MDSVNKFLFGAFVLIALYLFFSNGPSATQVIGGIGS